MTQFLDLVFSTTGALLGLFISVIWIAASPRSRMARRLGVSIATFYLLASIYAVPDGLSRLLASGYQRVERVDGPGDKTAIVILGSGDEIVWGWDEWLLVPNAGGGARALEAWRIYQLSNPRWVIGSGGAFGVRGRRDASSANMRDLLVRLGVPHDRIVLESTSRNTRDEAMAIAPMLRELGIDRIVLVTSAVHMRRAVGAFRAVGLNPLPAIAPDAKYRVRWMARLRPSREGLSLSSQVAHEVAGIPYYWARGWWK